MNKITLGKTGLVVEKNGFGMVWDGRSWVWRRGKSVGLCSILPQNCTGPYNKPGASVRGSGSSYYRKVCTRRAENEGWTKKGGRV